MISSFRAICFFLVSLCAFSCSKQNTAKEPYKIEGYAFTIRYTVLIGDPVTEEQKSQISHILQNVFKEVDDHFNRWNAQSELSQINKQLKNSPIKISAKMQDFIQNCTRYSLNTHALFDPSVYTVQSLWDKYSPVGKVPPSAELVSLKPAIGMQTLHVNNTILQKDYTETQLDFGGVVKGYSVDQIVNEFSKIGIKNCFVEWGGEIRASGLHPQGRSWVVQIMGPIQGEAIDSFELNNAACATSGDYMQMWNLYNEEKGTHLLYTHIINPKNASLLTVQEGSICSVTVISDDCMTSDVFATALMLAGTKDEAEKMAREFVEKHYIKAYWIVARSS